MADASVRDFASLSVGDEVSFSFEITEEDIDLFSRLTGDFNPLHADDAYAKTHCFESRVAHGLLVQSRLSQLIGMHLPGEHSLIVKVESDFREPVYAGNTLDVHGKITKKMDSTQMVLIEATIKNSVRIAIFSKIYVKVRA